MQSTKLRLTYSTVGVVPGEFDVRLHPAFSAFAAGLIAFAPAHALAQDREESVSVLERPRPEYDPLGLRFGGFNLNASLDLGVENNDNLFAVETGEEEDTIYTVSPNARLSSNWSRHALVADAGATFESHDEFSSEDVDTHYAGLYGRLDVGVSSNISARLRTSHEVESRTDPDSPVGGEPVEFDRTSGALMAQHRFNRFRVSAAVQQTQTDYDGAQSVRDNDETSLTGRVEAELTPRIGLVVQATTDERDYDNIPGQSSDGETYLAGVTVNFTDLMRGEATVGQFTRDYDSGASVDGTAVAANLEWYITRLTTLSFSARRDAEDSGATAIAQPYVNTEYTARVDHELLRNVILSAAVQSGKRDYEVLDREDDYMMGMAEAQYLVNRRVAIRARYQHDENQSDGADAYRDYDVNRITLGVSLRL